MTGYIKLSPKEADTKRSASVWNIGASHATRRSADAASFIRYSNTSP
jgi:hypothetical protein